MKPRKSFFFFLIFFFYIYWVIVYAGARTPQLTVTGITKYHLGQQARCLESHSNVRPYSCILHPWVKSVKSVKFFELPKKGYLGKVQVITCISQLDVQKLGTLSPKVGLGLPNLNPLFHQNITKENHGSAHFPWKGRKSTLG